MADSKLSGLPAGAAIGATDLFYTVQGGASVSTTGQQQIDLAKANVTKADVGLGSVPNTDTTNASNISSGTLAATRGGAGAVSGVMVADGAGNVAAAVSGTDLKTINSTSVLGSGNISVSASPAGSSGQLQGNISSAFAGVPNWAFDTTTGAMTYTGGTVTASTPGLVLSQTFNNAAVNFELIRVNLTNTASSNKSGIFAGYVGGSRKFNIDRNGWIGVGGPDITDNNPWTISFSNSSGIHFNGSTISIIPSGVASLDVTASLITANNPVKLKTYTVATLPTAADGLLVRATDLSSLTNGSTATGGGSNHGTVAYSSVAAAWIVLG